MSIRDALLEIKTQHPVSAALFFTPTVIFFILSVAHDFFCAWPFQPYAVIWWSLGAVVLTAALVETDGVSTDWLIGHEGRPRGEGTFIGPRLFPLILLSMNINGVLTVIGFLPYALIRMFIGSGC